VYQLSNDLWAEHQRLRQYAGDHTERWPAEGGMDWHIDSNVMDGIVASVIRVCEGCPRIYLPVVVH
jgi:hypothetical protein